MSNALYTPAKEKILEAFFSGATIKAALVSSDYAVALSTDEYVPDVSGYFLGTPQTLTNISWSGGAFNADDVTFSGVASGHTAKAVVLLKYITADATSPVLLYLDTITGFPLTTNGGDITIQWLSLIHI